MILPEYLEYNLETSDINTDDRLLLSEAKSRSIAGRHFPDSYRDHRSVLWASISL